MLREPLARLKSDYLYQISGDHPYCQSVRERYPSFRRFIDDPNNHNLMFSYLCRNEDDSIEQTIEFILNRFTWVGIQEDYRFSIKMLFLLFGIRVEPQRALRNRLVGECDNVILCADDIYAVHRNNEKDFKLYSFFLLQFQNRVAELYDELDNNRFFKEVNLTLRRSLA
jgi:hypothetical protein